VKCAGTASRALAFLTDKICERKLAEPFGLVQVVFGALWVGYGQRSGGIVQMYVSRTDRSVWIERSGGRPWLITPDKPEE